MTLVLVEGFDHFTDVGVEKGWAHVDGGTGHATTSSTASPGRLGVGRFRRVTAIGTTGAANCRNRKFLPSTTTKIVWGFAFQLPTFPYTDQTVFGVGTAADVTILSGRINVGTAKIDLYVGVTTFIAAIPLGIITGSWNYVELKVFVNGASSTVEVRMNGGPSLASTTCNLGSTAIGGVWIASGNQTGGGQTDYDQHSYADDMYVVDCNSGSSPTNDYLGDCAITTIVPTGAGASSSWTPLAGSNWAAVDEIGPDGDTTYVESSTVGHVDTYTMDDVAGVPDCYAIQTNLNAKKTDAGTRQIAPVVRQSGTDYVGATQTLTTSYVDYTQIMETNPATSGAWTPTQVNGDEFGVKVIA